jgi:glyoxylase-like metal-dependent hydrolase (beta-lactamase superfamily II)
MKSWIAVLSVAILLSVGVGTWAVYAQNPQAPPPPSKLEKLKDNLYVILSEGGNTTVYVTDEGVILVDAKFERNHDDIVQKVKSLTDKPIKYVINTHAHGDHTGGNVKMAPAMIVGHDNIRAAMIKGKLPGPPELTFSDKMTINLGGKQVVAMHFAPCHTDGDTFAYFPAEKVLASGDCFNTGNGQGVNLTGSSTFSFYMDYNTGGSLFGRMKVGDEALKLDFDTVVPGHGPVTTRAKFAEWRKDVESIKNRVAAMIREGKTKDDMAKALVAEFGWEPGGRAITNSLDGMIAEIKTRQP